MCGRLEITEALVLVMGTLRMRFRQECLEGAGCVTLVVHIVGHHGLGLTGEHIPVLSPVFVASDTSSHLFIE